MDCGTIEQTKQTEVPRMSWRLFGLGRKILDRLSGPERLDVEGMPDRVKRDLGFMDGRDPRYEAELWR